MKKILLLVFAVAALIACEDKKNNTTTNVETTETEMNSTDIAYASFGEKIEADNALTRNEIAEKFDALQMGDTLNVKFKSDINSVCSKKGCWMRLDLGDEEEIMVKFKDYGFFMPLDAKGEVVVNGKAFLTETSVDELKHYAEDAGKSEKEIAAITAPEKTVSFIADGVLLKK